MSNQTTIQKSNAIRKGSVNIQVSDANDFNNLVDIGAIRDPVINPQNNEESIEFDNVKDLRQYSEGDKVQVSFVLNEINWSNIERMNSGMISVTNVAGSSTSVTDEDVVLNDDESTRLANKNGDDTKVTSITVTGSGGTPSYTEGTDYEVFVDAEGYTNLVIVDGGGISDGETVEVDYSYTPNAHKKVTFNRIGEKSKIGVRLVNTDGNDKDLKIDIQDCTNIEQSSLDFASDDESEVATYQINLEGYIKEIIDEQQTT